MNNKFPPTMDNLLPSNFYLKSRLYSKSGNLSGPVDYIVQPQTSPSSVLNAIHEMKENIGINAVRPYPFTEKNKASSSALSYTLIERKVYELEEAEDLQDQINTVTPIVINLRQMIKGLGFSRVNLSQLSVLSMLHDALFYHQDDALFTKEQIAFFASIVEQCKQDAVDGDAEHEIEKTFRRLKLQHMPEVE